MGCCGLVLMIDSGLGRVEGGGGGGGGGDKKHASKNKEHNV